MRLGLALPHYEFSFGRGRRLSWTDLVETASWADSIGFDSLWVSDHVFLDLAKYGGDERPYSSFEYTSTLGALSIATSNAELGVLVACAALRPPAVLARSAETILSLSGRRFWLGLGAGWYRPDFDEAGVDFGSVSDRFARLRSTAESVRRFLGPESAVKVLVGGKGGPKVLEIVAEFADAWNVSWAIDPHSLRKKIEKLEERWKELGRDPEGPYVSVGLTCLVASDETELRNRYFQMFEDFSLRLPPDPTAMFESARLQRLVCTHEELKGRIDAYRQAGASEIICGFGPAPFSMWRKDVAEEFMSALA